ncbi:3-hydroxyacyl-[acyl-carrier-protein] dehydratase FabZ [Rickettsiales bacterium]|nr:3-hydroxyacyl-[acyl-carrier-protein] dehydratase FabZ [Rickettsiales bacterium]
MADLEIQDVLEILPHRYPFLMIDRVFFEDEKMVAVKNISCNEPFFVGHFPGEPIMPGVLIIEAMAQAAAIFAYKFLDVDSSRKLVVLSKVESAKFIKSVVPGDQLYLYTEKLGAKLNFLKCCCRAEVDKSIAASATITAAVVDRKR